MKRLLPVACSALACLALGCLEVTSVEPPALPLFGYAPVVIRGTDFAGLEEGWIEVTFGGVKAVNVHREPDATIRCLPQGSAASGPVDVTVRDTRIFGASATKAAAFQWVETAYPQFGNMYNFGPSLSAGVVDMGFDPPGQIYSVPGFVARQLGIHFPQRIVLEDGIPSLDSPNQVSHLFIGDGVRVCDIPATGQSYVPAPGELCSPVVVDMDSIPVLDLVRQLLPDIVQGILSGEGLASGIFQDAKIENRNYAIPGAQMVDYVYGTRAGFNYLQDFFLNPASALRNPVCLGEPVVRRIAERNPPADLVVGFDWFFDSVLFSHPPEQDLLHQMLFGILALTTGRFFDDALSGAPTCEGTWGVPLISTDGSMTRTRQPFQGFPEACDPNLVCLAAQPTTPGATDAAAAAAATLDFGSPKSGYVVDWILLGLVDPSADTNGNGFIDIDYHDPARNELTPQIVASILGADDPSDDPKAVVLSTMPWPAASPSGQGGEPGGGDDQFAEIANVGARGLAATFDEAFQLAGKTSNLVMIDTIEFLKQALEGTRPELTHLLDGDSETVDIYYEYELDPNGNPVKRGFLKYGGAFSLDHLHMSETMNAAIANLILESLNTRFGLSIPLADISATWRADPYSHVNYDPGIQCAYTGFGCP